MDQSKIIDTFDTYQQAAPPPPPTARFGLVSVAQVVVVEERKFWVVTWRQKQKGRGEEWKWEAIDKGDGIKHDGDTHMEVGLWEGSVYAGESAWCLVFGFGKLMTLSMNQSLY